MAVELISMKTVEISYCNFEDKGKLTKDKVEEVLLENNVGTTKDIELRV